MLASNNLWACRSLCFYPKWYLLIWQFLQGGVGGATPLTPKQWYCQNLLTRHLLWVNMSNKQSDCCGGSMYVIYNLSENSLWYCYWPGSCSSCSEEKSWYISLIPNNTKTIGRMTCHCFLWPISRDLMSSSYTTHWPGHHYKLSLNKS